jgi:putative FmdB family regulatory protein
MPIYGYQCGQCSHTQDHLQKVSDPTIDTCPQCGSTSYSKQLSAAGFQLKGNGWYATDFKGSGTSAKPATSAEGSAAPTSSAATSASSTPCGGSCACH